MNCKVPYSYSWSSFFAAVLEESTVGSMKAAWVKLQYAIASRRVGRYALQYIEPPARQVSCLLRELFGMSLSESLEELLPISRRSLTKLWSSRRESYSASDTALGELLGESVLGKLLGK
jgi:hypothetical protein